MLSYNQELIRTISNFMFCSVCSLQVQVWFPTFVTMQKEKQNPEE